MTNILVFSLAYDPLIGGAEIALQEIVKRLPQYHFHIVTMRFSSQHPVHEVRDNVSVYRVGMSGIVSVDKGAYLLLAQRVAREIIAAQPIACVWSLMASYAGFVGSVVAQKHALPFVLTLQEGDSVYDLQKRFALVRPWFKKIFTSATHVQAISQYLARFARDMGARCPVTVIPNGVDYAHFSAITPLPAYAQPLFAKVPGELVLITTSRLVQKNGIADVIDAMPAINPEVRFVIVGDGVLRPELEHQTHNLGIAGRVSFLGTQPHQLLPSFLQASDMFIRPSLSEGFGNSFVEAMASGIPVIATPVGGIPDFITDQETGYFVSPKSPHDIAVAVNALAADQALRFKLVQQALAMVRERYDWDTVAATMGARIFSTFS